jgi:hypothetical protein
VAFCMMCGQESTPGRKFCISCGANVTPATEPTSAERQPTPEGLAVIPPASPPASAASPNSPLPRGKWLVVAVAAAVAIGLGGISWWTATQRGSEVTSSAVPAASGAPAPGITVTASMPGTGPPSTPAPPSEIPSPSTTAPAPTVTVTETAFEFADGVIPKDQVLASVMTPCPNKLAGVTAGTGPEMLVDDDLTTGWRCDDRRDFAEGNVNTVSTTGQVVAFTFETPVTLTALEVVEGAARDSFRWCENGRLQRVQWDFRDGSAAVVTDFPDRRDFPSPSDLFFEIPLEPSRTTTSVTMTVLSIYPAGLNCSLNGEAARPWEYGATARPSEVRFVGRPS